MNKQDAKDLAFVLDLYRSLTWPKEKERTKLLVAIVEDIAKVCARNTDGEVSEEQFYEMCGYTK